MRSRGFLAGAIAFSLLISLPQKLFAAAPTSSTNQSGLKVFTAKGVVRGVKPESGIAVVEHEAISDYMDAMTMPFHVRDAQELEGLRSGDEIAFRLHVTADESWIEGITRVGSRPVAEEKKPDRPARDPAVVHAGNPLLDYQFTNELARPVSLRQFRGQALAITFFYTRCPIPDYCPRLSKNFQEASRKLASLPGAPTNWHFLSVTFDPGADTPPVLKAYAHTYQYDPAHWSFLTGPADKMNELAELSDVTFDREGSLLNHNFRTLIIDPLGHLQMVFPVTGDLSDAIVSEILKAAAVTNSIGALAPVPPPLSGVSNQVGKPADASRPP